MGVMPKPCPALWSLFRAAGTLCAHYDALLLPPGDVTSDASKESKVTDPSERAAITIQTHFRRYQQQKQEKK